MTDPSIDDQRWAGEPRLFSVEEANLLLLTVAPLLESLQSMKHRLDVARAALLGFTPAMRANGHGLDALGYEREIADLLPPLSAGIQQITALGIEIKDLDQGLIDFPSRRDGRIVYLCWRLGEGSIAYWHDLDAGFQGRQPL